MGAAHPHLRHRAVLRVWQFRATARCCPSRAPEGRVLRLVESRAHAPARAVGMARRAAARGVLRLLTRCGAALARGEPRAARTRPRRRRAHSRPRQPLRRGGRRRVPCACATSRRRSRARGRCRHEQHRAVVPLRARDRARLLSRRRALHTPRSRRGRVCSHVSSRCARRARRTMSLCRRLRCSSHSGIPRSEPH
jgi:hypothetical protein